MSVLKQMRRGSSLALCLFLLAAGVQGRAETIDQAGIILRGELGLSQDGHGYVRPRIRYSFPVASSRLFAETIYEQRLNENLEGTVDFWIKGGFLASLGRGFVFEVSANHLCRHALSRPGPFVLSVNEALGRVWWSGRGAQVGVGAGLYFNTSPLIFEEQRLSHGLAVVNFGFDDMFGSIFSLNLEFKFVDFNKVLPDMELRARLGSGIFLFVRNVTTYDFPNTTKFGLGFGTDAPEKTNVSFVSSEALVTPSDEAYKLFVDQRATLDFARTAEHRFLLQIEADVPVLKGEEFLGLFRPESVNYPFAIQYEQRLGSGPFLFGYGAYEISIPVDTLRRFSTALGLGLGLRNQRVFQTLGKPFRYEVSAGLNSSQDYDARLSLGVNSVNLKPDIGLEASVLLDAKARHAGLKAFVEFGAGTRVRLFLVVNWIHELEPAVSDRTRVGIGLDFFQLFCSNS